MYIINVFFCIQTVSCAKIGIRYDLSTLVSIHYRWQVNMTPVCSALGMRRQSSCTQPPGKMVTSQPQTESYAKAWEQAHTESWEKK